MHAPDGADFDSAGQSAASLPADILAAPEFDLAAGYRDDLYFRETGSPHSSFCMFAAELVAGPITTYDSAIASIEP